MDAIDVLNNLRSVNIEAIAEEALEENEPQIADLMAVQLSQGKRADGSDILPSYTPLTIEIKKATGVGLGAVTDRTTLFDTGEHYSKLYADVKGEVIEYGSKSSVSEKLQKKYGTAKGSIYGLAEESREELVEGSLGKSWQRGVENATGLKIS